VLVLMEWCCRERVAPERFAGRCWWCWDSAGWEEGDHRLLLGPRGECLGLETFFNDLYRRGLKGEGVELIVTDGGAGLLAALPLVYSQVPLQRCWAHKIRNILDKVRKIDQSSVKDSLHRVMNAKHLVGARHAAKRFVEQWNRLCPRAVRCLREDLDELLTFFSFRDPSWRKAIRTTNAIERRFREVRRRTRPMGCSQTEPAWRGSSMRCSPMKNKQQGIATPFLVTQNF